MAYRKDLTGQRFGRMAVVEFAGQDSRRRSLWLCRCDCGNTKVVQGYSLGKYTVSCGCLQRETASKTFKKHGQRKSRLYNIWIGIKDRCNNETNGMYYLYGARGISVCEEWEHDFQAFFDWSMANGYREGLSLDRRDNYGPYSPENCRWATQKEQQNNRRNNRVVEHNGKSQTIAAWAEEIGINYGTLYKRVVLLGWDLERALTAC